MPDEILRTTAPKTEHRGLATTMLAVAILAPAAAANTLTIPANFTGTSITAGNHIWFTSMVKPSGLRNRPMGSVAQDPARQFTISGNTQARPVADAMLPFSPMTAKLSANSNTATDRGNTSAQNTGFSGNILVGGDVLPVTSNLAGGLNPETWSAAFSSDSGTSASWQGAKAVSSHFSTDLNTLHHAGSAGAPTNGGGTHAATRSGMAPKPANPAPESAGLASTVLLVAALICLAMLSYRLRHRGSRLDDRLASGLRTAIERGVIAGDPCMVLRRQPLRSVS